MRPTLELSTVGGSISKDIIDKALERRGLVERVDTFFIRPGEQSSLYQFRFPRHKELAPYLSLTVSCNALGETRARALLGTYSTELAEGLVAGVLGIALAQPPNRVPRTLDILSLTADERTAHYDTALQGITNYARSLEHSLAPLNWDGSILVSLSPHSQGIICTGLNTLAQHLKPNPNN